MEFGAAGSIRTVFDTAENSVYIQNLRRYDLCRVLLFPKHNTRMKFDRFLAWAMDSGS